jgi:hypothetical protein
MDGFVNLRPMKNDQKDLMWMFRLWNIKLLYYSADDPTFSPFPVSPSAMVPETRQYTNVKTDYGAASN